MSYAIVFSSRTGNTALLAQSIRDTLPGDCLYFGTPDPKALEAETVYVGFWTDKGSCDESIAQFLKTLTNQKVFLFGTAGFGGFGKSGRKYPACWQLYVSGQDAAGSPRPL